MAFTCSLCDRGFRTNRSLLQHIGDSQNHLPCAKCNFVGATPEDLVQHYRDDGCMIVCEGCLDSSGRDVVWHSKGTQYWQHVQDQNVCDICERHFHTDDNLRNHKLTHRSAVHECLACYRKFKTYSGMIVHLESGVCDSGIDILDLNETAA
ncbi:hypothetical protein K491DRAFT_236150 [Lophiostoma macrostomum CBS 122681]|uniref:C2H2-type domain-containing protein n=1 Tax=Lophiostoma macrostomum CBS 122681 TaxID=1314788 RepID=A0A6A6TI46_9PLEO|nr:hypothetical protein K491DRAFT_236150 [Lophiostoma macrostomum CBS 122681]